MNKKRIAIIISKLVGGGAERVLINLLESLNYDKYEIDVFVGLPGGVLEEEIPGIVNIKYIFPNRFFEILTSVTLRYFNSELMHKIFGRKISNNYDVGICFLDSYYTYFLNNSKGQIERKHTIIHSSLKTYSYSFKKYKPESFTKKTELYKTLDGIIFVSKDSMNEFEDLYGKFKNHKVIYNPINRKRILDLSASNKIVVQKTAVFELIAVGSHKAIKNYESLIVACSILKKKNIQFHLTILGEGELYPKHLELIRNLDLAKEISLEGFVLNPYPYMSRADAFIMPSIAEGLPTAMCEAMILGIPIIATNAPGCKEVIDNGRYGLITETNPISISKAIECYIQDKEKLKEYRKKSLQGGMRFQDHKAVEEYEKIFSSKQL